MEANVIKAAVTDRRIKVEGHVAPTAGNRLHDSIEITLDAPWTGLDKRVTFYRDGVEITLDWDGESAIVIPWEVLQESGSFGVTVVGSENGEDRLVTYAMSPSERIRVRLNGDDEGVEPSAPTQDVIRRVEAVAADMEQKRDSGYFDGKDGKDADIAGAEAAKNAANQAATNANAAAQNANEVASDIEAKANAGDFNGKDGNPGDDGFSPVASVTKSGKVSTITVTDKSGTTTATVSDGKDAPPYDDSAIQARMAALEEQFSKQDTTNLWGVSFAGSSNTQGVQRLYAAVSLGMLSYATETDAGKYPFDQADPWKFTHWLVRYDADGYPVKVASMTMDGVKSPGWDENEATLDRFVEFPNSWFMRDDNAGVYLVSSVEREGFTRFYAKADGTEPDMLPLIPCYKMANANGAYSASTGTGCSRPGMNPHWGTFTQHRTLQQTASRRGHGGTTWFENWKQVMCYVELASRDVQGVLDFNGKALPGFSGGCYTNNASYNAVATTATNTNVVQLANATNYFAVGQTVNICQGWISADKVTTRKIVSINGNSVTLDGEPFSVETGWFMYNMDWATGHCDSLKGHTGAVVLSNNRYGMKWRGIEDLWGGSAEDVVDIRLTCAGTAASDGYDVHYCADALKAQLAGDPPSSDYVKTGMNLKRADGYIKLCQRFEGDARLVMPAEVVGASSTTYMADYCWTNSSYADNRSVRSGADWSYGSGLGVFYRRCGNAASAGGRYSCARLFLEP
ncbi:MAG: hypothetical protein KBT28_12455 [Bacteroidales bacterium]|nr:hypothetical protein [Candidatus Colimorpha merdihippi]